jgi:hypothetical protein
LNKFIYLGVTVITAALTGPLNAQQFHTADASSASLGEAMRALPEPSHVLYNPALNPLLYRAGEMIFVLPSYAVAKSKDLDAPYKNFLQAVNKYESSPGASTKSAVNKAVENLAENKNIETLALSGSFNLPYTPIAISAFATGYYESTITTDQLAAPVFNDTQPQLSDYGNQITRRSVALIEIGTSFSKVIRNRETRTNQLSVGITPKLQTYRLTSQTMVTANSNTTDLGGTRTDGSAFNLDLGIVQEYNFNWIYAITANNVLAKKTVYANSNEQFKIQPTIKIGGAFKQANMKIVSEVDLLETTQYTAQYPERYFNAGIQYGVLDHIKFRCGIKQNMLSERQTHYRFGFNISTGRINIDLAYMHDEELTGTLATLDIAL